jgi:hypothetical protein
VDTQLCSKDSKFKNWHQGMDSVYTICCSALTIMVANLGDILTIIFSYNLSSLFHQEMDCVFQDEDVTHDINKTTLRPYSFHIFTSAAWTELHTGGVMPQGQSPLHLAGKSHFKCPLASQLKEVVREQKRPRHTKTSDENSVPEEVQKVDEVLVQRRTWRGCK